VRIFSWIIQTPATGGIPGPRMKQAVTCTRLDAFVTAATSATFNIEERTAIGSAGTNILASDMVADVTGETMTDFSNAGIAADNWLWVDIASAVGTPGYLEITLSCTVD